MERSKITLDGSSLTIQDLVNVTRHFFKVELTAQSIEKINYSSQIVQNILSKQHRVYGVTTGFGFLQDVAISPSDSEQLQLNLVRSHSAGVGAEFPEEIVRGMILLQANKFARGNSGIRLSTVNLLLKLLNKRITPIVPSKGSLGASGDLAPLAHLTAVLIGEGEAIYNQKRLPSIEALKEANLSPITLIAKEGLALLNGTQAMTSIAALALSDGGYLLRIANIAAALSMEVHRANIDSLNPLIHKARPHPGQIFIAQTLLEFLEGSHLVYRNVGRQDCYSLRCVPAVHGASYDTLQYVKKVIETEMNSSTDNPLIFSLNEIYSGGNFHGQPVALVMDFLGIALAEIGNISERRIEHLLNPTLSGLPAFLTPNSGLNSGFMIAQYTAASLVSENKHLASPASVDSIPVSANQEDHVSMGSIAASQTRQIIEHLEIILSIELLCACQAIDLAGIEKDLSPSSHKVFKILREVIPVLESDRELSSDIKKCSALIKSRAF
jgi:histidine ammonia-lyase